MSRTRFGLVTAYPPSTGPLAEYGWHLVDGLRACGRLDEFAILADRVPEGPTRDPADVDVHRCWTFGNPLIARSVIRAARHLGARALWFNLHMTSAGNNRLSWFGGICAPAIARAAGFKVVVTLHNMLGMTNLAESGVRARPWDLVAAHAATRTLAQADAICVLRPEYVSILRKRYGMTNAVYMPHGTLGVPIERPLQNDDQHLLVFGHFGSYKRLEPVFEGVIKLLRAGARVRLTVAGTDSRHTPGYLEEMRERYRSVPEVEFVGYVPEERVPSLFQSSTLCILPYATMAGMSGVAIQAAMHGVPIVASNIGEFRAIGAEGLRMRFFDWPDAGHLAWTLTSLLGDPAEREHLARENLTFVRQQRMVDIAAKYFDLLECVLAGQTVSQLEPLDQSSSCVVAAAK